MSKEKLGYRATLVPKEKEVKLDFREKGVKLG